MSILTYIQTDPTVFIVTLFFFSLLVGSFLNVVIYRIPLMMEREFQTHCQEFLTQNSSEESPKKERFDLVSPGSHCPACKHSIKPWENIPIVSYLLQKGQCRACGTAISVRYPIVELGTAVLVAVVAWRFGYSWMTLAGMLLTFALICLTVIDIDHFLLPDSITIPLLWLGLIFNLFGVYTDIHSAVIGAIAGYLSLWSVYMLFKLITGKEGMGFGDFKLLAALGAWLGWQALPGLIIMSSLVGAIVGVCLIVFGSHGRQQPLPFGPYLAAAGWIALLYGDHITEFYLKWAVAG